MDGDEKLECLWMEVNKFKLSVVAILETHNMNNRLVGEFWGTLMLSGDTWKARDVRLLIL